MPLTILYPDCPQHITRRYSEAEVEVITRELRNRAAELEARIAHFE